jgi:hypothetical protein
MLVSSATSSLAGCAPATAAAASGHRRLHYRDGDGTKVQGRFPCQKNPQAALSCGAPRQDHLCGEGLVRLLADGERQTDAEARRTDAETPQSTSTRADPAGIERRRYARLRLTYAADPVYRVDG